MKYTACYCEENVWYLCADTALATMEKTVVWVSSLHQICPLWCQQASASIDEPVWWDYHVFILARSNDHPWMVWDLDSTLGLPVSGREYFERTFRSPMPLQPVFRVMGDTYYRNTFSSDRSHMRNEDGSWQATPPEWPAIRTDQLTFTDMLNMRSSLHGELQLYG